jgi:hypothetical protein
VRLCNRGGRRWRAARSGGSADVSSSLLVQKAEREICGETASQELNRRVLRNLDLGGEEQRTTRCSTGREKHPQTAEQQALNLIRRQSLELCRSHRTPSFAAGCDIGAIAASIPPSFEWPDSAPRKLDSCFSVL